MRGKPTQDTTSFLNITTNRGACDARLKYGGDLGGSYLRRVQSPSDVVISECGMTPEVKIKHTVSFLTYKIKFIEVHLPGFAVA